MRKPNVEERVLLKQIGCNPRNFLRLDKDWESFTFVEVISGKKLLVRR